MAADKAQLRNYSARSESLFRPSALTGFRIVQTSPWGCGSVGRALRSHRRGQGFNSSPPLQKRKIAQRPSRPRGMTFLMAIALILSACGGSSEDKAYSGLELTSLALCQTQYSSTHKDSDLPCVRTLKAVSGLSISIYILPRYLSRSSGTTQQCLGSARYAPQHQSSVCDCGPRNRHASRYQVS